MAIPTSLRPPAMFATLRVAFAVLVSLSLRAVADKVENHCAADVEAVGTASKTGGTAQMALLQQGFAKQAAEQAVEQAAALESARLAQSLESASSKKIKHHLPIQRLPPFPTLLPGKAAEPVDDAWHILRGGQDDEEPTTGVATVRLDSMSRPLTHLLEAGSESVKRPPPGVARHDKKRDTNHRAPAARKSAPKASASQILLKAPRKRVKADPAQKAGLDARDDEDTKGGPLQAVRPGVSGEAVSLDESGYKAVAALRSHKEMKNFVRRVFKKLGYDSASEGDLDGFVSYYSGEKGVQTLDRMQQEIRSIAGKRGYWIVAMGNETDLEVFQHPRRLAPPR